MATPAELLDLAVRYQKNGDLRQAEELCRQLIQADPGYAAAYHLLGLIAHQAGDHQAAVNLLRQASTLNPSDVSCLFNLAIVFMHLGRQDEAVEDRKSVV